MTECDIWSTMSRKWFTHDRNAIFGPHSQLKG